MKDNLWVHKSGMIYLRKMVDGKLVIRSTKTKKMGEARKIADMMKAEILLGEWDLSKRNTKVRFGELIERYLGWSETNHKSHSSYKGYCNNLLHYFGEGVYLDKITTWDIQKYISERQRKVKPASVNRDIACLKHMFKLASDDWNLTKNNPTLKIKALKGEVERRRYLNDSERERLLNACSNGPWYLHPIVLIATNTGMRRGEILGLKWSNVDLVNTQIAITKSKNGQQRYVPMNEILVNLFSGMKRDEEMIFPYKAFRRAWKTALKEAGITDLRFHDLRHEFASQLVMVGKADLITVKEILGHSSLRMVQRYAHLTQEHKQKAVERLVELQRKPVQEAAQTNVIMFPER